MGDQAHDFAERKIAEFQAEVRETYQQAQADAQEALSRFLKRFEKEDERKREKVKAGELSEADYKAWRKGKILRSRQLSSTLDQVSQAMTEANQVAVAALAGRLPEVYAENANFAAFQTCKASGLDLAFSLVDAPTVQHMLTAGEALFHVPALDVAKDVAWNRKLMASQLTQGVLLGESIPKMARRVQRVTGSNIATAVRTARTAVTGAENAGRVSSYERAKGMGISLKQEWVATLDNRTRHSHRQLDGVKAEVGDTFPNGCRFPGDPTARYAEICNCRCTLVAAVEGFETDDAKRASKLPKGMTYEEWKAGHAERKPHDSSGRTMGEFLGQPSVKAQLDKRGMSENQARKALSAELKRRGADGNAFRRMQRSEQQEVWLAATGRAKAPVAADRSQIHGSLSKSQRSRVDEVLKGSDPTARAAYERHKANMVYLGDPDPGDCAHFTPMDGKTRTMGVRLDKAKAFEESVRPSGTTWFHEFGHHIDYLSGGGRYLSESYRDNVFGKTIKKEAEAYIDARYEKLKSDNLALFERAINSKDARWLLSNGYIDERNVDRVERLIEFGEHRDDYEWLSDHGARRLHVHRNHGAEEWYAKVFYEEMADIGPELQRSVAYRSVADEISAMGNARNADVSDLFSGATLNKCEDGWMHDTDYWNGVGIEDLETFKLAHEGFAEFFSASTANPESLEMLRKYFPESGKIFDELIKIAAGG
mgnify:CR=1 FL=1